MNKTTVKLLLALVALGMNGCATLRTGRRTFFVTEVTQVGRADAPHREVFHKFETPTFIVMGRDYVGGTARVVLIKNGIPISASPEIAVTKDGAWLSCGRTDIGSYRAQLYVDNKAAAVLAFAVVE